MASFLLHVLGMLLGLQKGVYLPVFTLDVTSTKPVTFFLVWIIPNICNKLTVHHIQLLASIILVSTVY